MSTLPGLASKGEKGKSKYQSLDINNLYRVSRGESLEKQQQKSTLPLKHGMQSLGRVPSARRPPANLPSIKSEHSGTDAAVSLVPSGGPGWGKQEPTSTAANSSSTSTVTNSSVTSPSPANTQISAHQAAIALPVTTTIPPPVKHNTSSATPATTDKSWSSVMTGSDLIHPPPYQSPQFQHEFPSLSAGDGGPPRTGTDTQYGPGPSLRPQTEGSWMQGGSRANSEGPPRSSSAPLGAPPQLSAQVGLTHQSLPPQYQGILPQFMYRGNFSSNGHGSPSVTNMPPPLPNNGRNRVESRPPPPRSLENEEVARRPIIKEEDLNRMDDMTKDMGWAAQDDIDYNQKLAFSDDESVSETNARKPARQNSQKEQEKAEMYSAESEQSKNWNRSGNATVTINRARSTDEDEILAQKRRQQHQVLLSAAEKAKQRKEEEEKRYLESKQAAGKKLQDLLNKSKRDKDQDESQGTISPSVVPPQPITPAPIPVPDWEKERDKSRNDAPDEKSASGKPHRESSSDFRQLTQIEGRNFVRKDTRNAERERDRDGRERGGPGFSRQLQNLPPRLQKKQQLRNNSSPQPPPMSYNQQHQYDQRWMPNNQIVNKTSPTSSTRKNRGEWDGNEKEHEDEHSRYHSNDEVYRGPNRLYAQDSGRKSSSDNRHEEDSRDFRNQNFDYKKEKYEDKWDRSSRDKYSEKEDVFDEHNVAIRQNSDEWHGDRHEKYNSRESSERYERPQRPDSRDSRASRDSRHSRDSMRDSEPRDHIASWADSITYDEKKKDHLREDRRQVPGPITKEKIEADEKHNEKRNLTQLKRGGVPEKKQDITEEKTSEKEQESWGAHKKEISSNDGNALNVWADDVIPATVSPDATKFTDAEKANKAGGNLETGSKQEAKQEDSEQKQHPENADINRQQREEKRSNNINRNRSIDSQLGRNQGGWDRSGPIVYRTFFKKGRGPRTGGLHRSSGKAGEWHGTDSDASNDEISISTESGNNERGGMRNSQKSPKTARKMDKDEKNKEMKYDRFSNDRRNDRYQDSNKREYEPRGEPSRHGRGGGNIRNRGGLSKRIDGYGPPPSKSPFGHSDEKEKKQMNEETLSEISDDKSSSKIGNLTGAGGLVSNAKKDVPLFQTRVEKFDRNKIRKIIDNRKPKPKSKDDNCDTSDHSDDSANKDGGKFGRKISNKSPQRSRNLSMNSSRRNNPPPRLLGDKRGGGGNFNPNRTDSMNVRQNSSGSLRSGQGGFKKDLLPPKDDLKLSDVVVVDANAKNGEETENADGGELEDKNSIQGDSDGFQEVKSKKTVKERQKSVEDKLLPKQPAGKIEVPSKPERKGKPPQLLSQQQIASIPSLMDTPVNPPAVIPQPSNKNQYDRPRQKLPPRLAKQRENSRLQKAQMQHGMCDVNDINKVNQNMNLYALKDNASQVPLMSNAWEKPLGTQLRNTIIEQDSVLSVGIENCKSLDQPQSPGQNASPNNDKMIAKSNQLQDKSVLDGSTAPVNTIIFENTNYKLAPGIRNNRNDKARGGKLEDGPTNIDNAVVMPGFNKPIADLLNKSSDKQSDIQIQLAFNKEDNADMKLDFFDSEISHLTDDKSSKNLTLPRSMHAMTSSNSTISPSTADLNFKIASVKKVWESSMPPVIEHSVGQEDGSFSSSFGPDTNSLDPTGVFTKGTDTPDDGHEGYSPSPNQNASNSTTNVCKVKPTQQVPGTTGQTVVGTHQQHSGMISSGLMGPLSSPPIQPVIGPNVGLSQPPQQFTANQHIGYQASLGGNTQYGMSAIPSPPTVLFNSTQQIQQQAGLYGGFPIDQLGGQRGSQYSQYPNPYNLGQTASSPYSQSLYLQTAQPHPPPTAQAPPDLYQNLNNYRMTATGPFGQNQQLNNPTTVLISSTSNSLMSAAVKPSSQPISAIGTKTGAVGQTYQQQSQQGQQLYMTYDPSVQPNYLTNTGVMPRGPAGPVQNNVVPALQPSSSYYSGSTGGQTGYFQTPGNSTLQSAGPLQQHQAGYGLQGNVFGTHNQSHTSAGLQLSSHFLSQMQLAAMNVPQFRSQNLQNTSYMKGMGNQQIGDQSNRSQQLKSPGTQQEVLSSVFNSGPQIPSPKSRQNCKQPPPQPSPTTQHKYNLYQSVGNQAPSQLQRYPTPIQRPPSNFQPTLGSVQSNGTSNPKHRANNNNNNTNKGPTRQYYSPQGGGLSSSSSSSSASAAAAAQSEKSDESKLGDGANSNTGNSSNSNSANIVSKATIGSVTTATVNQATEMGKDLNKDDSSAMKD